VKDIEITARLKDLFTSYRIVYWYDEDAEFSDTARNLDMGDITILRLDETGPFTVKVCIEYDNPDGKYLIYAPFVEPPDKENWLLDSKLYSHTFRADMASVILEELGLKNKGLRKYIASRKKYFSSQERIEKLKKWILPEDNAEDIDLKMIGVITKATLPSVFPILIAMLEPCCTEEAYDPHADLKSWEDVQKFGLEDAVWKLVKENFGYDLENPSLSTLLISILITDFANNLSGDLPIGLNNSSSQTLTDP